MNCINCGTQLPEGGMFCPSCGTRCDGKKECIVCHRPIPTESKYCTFCGSRVDGKKICVKCGTEIDGLFCPFCGTKHGGKIKNNINKECYSSEPVLKRIANANNKTLPLILVGVTFILFLCAIFAGMILSIDANELTVQDGFTLFNSLGSELENYLALTGSSQLFEFNLAYGSTYIISTLSLWVNLLVALASFIWAIVISVKSYNKENIVSVKPLKLSFTTLIITMSVLKFMTATYSEELMTTSFNGWIKTAMIIGVLGIIAITVLKQIQNRTFEKTCLINVIPRGIVVIFLIILLNLLTGAIYSTETIKFSSMEMTTVTSLVTATTIFTDAYAVFIFGFIIVLLSSFVLCNNVFGIAENKKIGYLSLILLAVTLIFTILHCVYAFIVVNDHWLYNTYGSFYGIATVMVIVLSALSLAGLIVNRVITFVKTNKI